MVERINGKTILTTPVSAEDLEGIKIGDIIYLNGSMTTCRDVAHRRVVEEGREIPVDVRNNAIFHAGPAAAPRVLPYSSAKFPPLWKNQLQSCFYNEFSGYSCNSLRV